jgi:hypothetical protein
MAQRAVSLVSAHVLGESSEASQVRVGAALDCWISQGQGTWRTETGQSPVACGTTAWLSAEIRMSVALLGQEADMSPSPDELQWGTLIRVTLP